MDRENKIVHSNLFLIIFIVFVVAINYSPSLATNYPTSTIIKNVNVNGDTVRNIVLDWGVLVSGKVTDNQGNSVKDVVVTAIGKDFLMQNTTATDNTGKYKLSLPKGTYTFTFNPPFNQSRAAYKSIEKETVNNDKKLNVTLPNGVFLSGNLMDYLNQPVTDSIVYAKRLSDDLLFACFPNPVTGKFMEALLAGEYDITAIRTSCVNNPYIPFRKHTNISVGKKNIQNDTQLDGIKMPQGVVLQGTVKDNNNQTIVAIITILNLKDLKAKNPWVGAQTASNSIIDPSYKVALEKKNSYALQVVPVHGEGSPNSGLNPRATFEIIKKVKMKKKDSTVNITVEDGKILSGTIKDKDGKIVKNAVIIITNIKKANDLFKYNKIMIVTVSDKNGKYSYPLVKGKYIVVAYPPFLDQNAIETDQYRSGLNPEGNGVQDYLIRFLKMIRANSMGFTRK